MPKLFRDYYRATSEWWKIYSARERLVKYTPTLGDVLYKASYEQLANGRAQITLPEGVQIKLLLVTRDGEVFEQPACPRSFEGSTLEEAGENLQNYFYDFLDQKSEEILPVIEKFWEGVKEQEYVFINRQGVRISIGEQPEISRAFICDSCSSEQTVILDPAA